MERSEKGRRGEELAADAYRQKGYQLLVQNFRTRMGEIDLVLQKDGLLVFAEVKTRRKNALVSGAEAVDARKQHRILAAARGYLAQKKLSDPFMRFDVVEVILEESGVPQVRIIENAFIG